MADKIRELCKKFGKYEEIIVYLIVGVMTTIVSWFCMFFVNIVIFGNPLYPTSTQNLVLSIVSWTAGVLFSYPTNRAFVFKSKDAKVVSEFAKFVVSRVFTLLLDIVIRQVLGFLGVDVFITTIVSSVLVVIGNYMFSKLLVFRKK